MLRGDQDRDFVGAETGRTAGHPADEALVDLDQPGEHLAVGPTMARRSLCIHAHAVS
ncbi:hypothetical protein HNP00_002056 [Arthrobacter sp. AZCC_0090]|nr:hypothetical protein [Arthrobacter sp. AZCC_0090]